MKVLLLVVLTLIFVLQSHHSDCKFAISFSPHKYNISINIGNVFKAAAKSTSNKIFDFTTSVKQSLPKPNVFVESLNTILSKDGTSRQENPSTLQTTTTKNDKFKEILTKDVLDDTSEENDIFDINAPVEKFEYKCSNEDLAVHMSSLNSPQLIAMHGYPAESHTIVTDDGYILTIHRIPYAKTSKNKVSPRKTVLLHHGLLGSSVHWLIPGPRKGLGYILSDAGYDVWLANVRGNPYSRAHVSRKVESFEFWNFTFHEVSQHDLPAVIDYIMELKGSDVKINYIGHSMGTTVLFALLSTKTQYNKVLRAGFALAPVAYMTHVKSPIKLLAKYSNNIHRLMKLLGRANEFLPQNPVLKWLSKHSIELIKHDEEGIVEDSMSVLFGHNVEQFNKTLLPLILGQGASSASTKTLVHYAQEIKQSGKFQMFDYGFAGNLKQYGTVYPPEYPLHKITLPIALFSSENDWLSSVIDAKNLYEQLVNPIDHYIVQLKEFNHIDFLFAIDAPTFVYSRLLQLLEEDVSEPDSSVRNLSDNLDDLLRKENNEIKTIYKN